MKELIVCLVYVVHFCQSAEMIYMKKSQLDDQASSASGYSYQTVSGNPVVFTAYSSDDTDFEKYKDSDNYKEFVNFGYPPITVGKFVVNSGPPQLLPLEVIKPQPILVDSYGRPVTDQDYYAGHNHEKVLVNNHLPSTKYEEYDLEKDNSKYLKEHGNVYNGDHSSSKGEKGQTGYKKFDGFEKGLKSRYGKNGQKAYYNEEGGDKRSDYDVASNYGDKHESNDENKGESFKQAKGHKKGSKTSGFHKVYHKDEYKKDHSFYDESDANGYYKKYGNSKGDHSEDSGGYYKGGKYSKAYKDSDYGKKGFTDKGQEEEESKGYREKDGEEKYYNDLSEYKNHHNNENTKAHVYDDKESEHY